VTSRDEDVMTVPEVVTGMTAQAQARAFRLPVVAGLIVLSLAMLWPSLAGLERSWREVFAYQHGYIVAAISLVWLARLRWRLDAVAAPRGPVAIVPVVLAIAAWLVALRANSDIGQQLMIPLIPLVLVWAAAGDRAARLVALPLFYLYFAIPIWDYLVPALQSMTTVVAEHVLGFMGVPVKVSGHLVAIPAGTFAIVEGCSGKRYLTVGLAVAVAAGVAYSLQWRRMTVLLAGAAIMALIINWVRVITIIYAGHVTHMQHYLVAEDHVKFGTAIFVPLLAGIFLLARYLARHESGRDPDTAVAEAPPRTGAIAWQLPAAVVLATIVLRLFHGADAASDARLAELPLTVDTWQGPVPADSDWQPHFVGASSERRAAYVTGDGRVDVYVNVYGTQAPRRELIYFENTLTPSDKWPQVEPLPAARLRLASGDFALAQLLAEDVLGKRWVISYVYNVGGSLTVSEGVAQLFYGVKTWMQPAPSGVVASAVRCGESCDVAQRVSQRFWREQGQRLLEVIPTRSSAVRGVGTEQS
jgi:EpsI family protein